MTKVTVAASTEYDILIGEGILDYVGEWVSETVSGRCAMVVTDETTHELFYDHVAESLTRAGFTVFSYVIAPGERSKNAENYIGLLEDAASNGLCRNDVFVALGGGVVGDLTGFAAASFERGIDYIQIPTTVLAAVDSSVGGKTAIDLKAGKNMVGAFHQPRLVVCDTDTMDSLSDEVFDDGLGEVFKYAVLNDRQLCRDLITLRQNRSDYLTAKYYASMGRKNQPNRLSPETKRSLDATESSASVYKYNLELIIKKCVRMKSDYVMKDEYDKGSRAFLNLGHTIGHGIERLSGYTVSHGRSVATGIVYAAKIACHLGICDEKTVNEISDAALALGYDLTAPYSALELARAAYADKKRSGRTITLVLPARIGACELRQIDIAELEGLIG